MLTQTYQAATTILATVAVAASVSIGIYMAQPWGDNYAYQDLSGYLFLIVYLAWACSPYAYLVWASRRFKALNVPVVSRFIAALLICIGGIIVLIDTAFIHLDAQGGLIFVFLPLYQWLAVGFLEAVGHVIGR